MSQPRLITPQKAERLRKAADQDRRKRRKSLLLLLGVVLLLIGVVVADYFFIRWQRHQRHLRHQQHQTAAWLSNGVAVVIHYKRVSFRNPLLKKVTWEERAPSQ